jgi:hypothetical protein
MVEILNLIYFMDATHESLHFIRCLAQSNIMNIRTSFHSIIILFDEAFKYGDVRHFEAKLDKL